MEDRVNHTHKYIYYILYFLKHRDLSGFCHFCCSLKDSERPFILFSIGIKIHKNICAGSTFFLFNDIFNSLAVFRYIQDISVLVKDKYLDFFSLTDFNFKIHSGHSLNTAYFKEEYYNINMYPILRYILLRKI